MTLTLVAASLNDQPLSQPITAVFDSRGGTIGRADHNTMTLPDPQRHVSRLQAEVLLHGRDYLLRNVGAANPILVGSRTLAHGESAILTGEDDIRIGGYLLKASQSDAPVPQPSPTISSMPMAPREAVVAPVVPVVEPVAASASTAFGDLLGPGAGASDQNPFADLMGTPSAAASASAAPRSTDPFADLLGAAPVAAHAAPAFPSAPVDPFADLMPPPPGVHARSAAVAAPPPAAPRLPDDFDPFALPVSLPAQPSRETPATQDPFADLMPPGDTSGSIDNLFGLGGDTGRGSSTPGDPLADFMGSSAAFSPATGPAAGLSGVSTDPLALFGLDAGAAPVPTQPMQPAQSDQVPAFQAAWQPPRVQAPRVEPMAPAPMASASPAPLSGSSADPAALWAAFCQGAGIEVSVPPHEVAARLRDIGCVLRSAVDGTLQLMAVRASTKHELRAGVTVIQQRDNNPLKFSPDARLALEQLLQPPLRGFLDGPAAMDDAMHDLVGHAIGSVAGLRAAVEGMLERFAPQALESKLAAGSLLDSLLPMNRKARLWDLYLQNNQAIREEAQEDFHTLFGKAFVAAYEQQIERLRRDAAVRR